MLFKLYSLISPYLLSFVFPVFRKVVCFLLLFFIFFHIGPNFTFYFSILDIVVKCSDKGQPHDV